MREVVWKQYTDSCASFRELPSDGITDGLRLRLLCNTGMIEFALGCLFISLLLEFDASFLLFLFDLGQDVSETELRSMVQVCGERAPYVGFSYIPSAYLVRFILLL